MSKLSGWLRRSGRSCKDIKNSLIVRINFFHSSTYADRQMHVRRWMRDWVMHMMMNVWLTWVVLSIVEPARKEIRLRNLLSSSSVMRRWQLDHVVSLLICYGKFCPNYIFSKLLFNTTLPWSCSTVSRVCIWLLQVAQAIDASQTVGRIGDVIMIIVIVT